jgi:hypothetical protein
MWAEMLRASGTTVGRSEALSVPAVRRGRNMLCSVATMPLEEVGPDNRVVASALLGLIDPDVPNVVTIAQTVEDLVFEGISWWRVTARDFAGFPVAARHLDESKVSVNPPAGHSPAPLPSDIDPRRGVVWIDGKPVPGNTVIRFDSPNPAVLKHAGREIRRAVLLDKAASMYADDPRPADYFTPAENAEEIDDDEVDGILARWKAARKRRATAWVPASMKYNAVDSPAPRDLQLVELQRQASLDIANALGIDPEDLGISTTSRTYSNDVDRRRNKLNDVLLPYMRAITDRLSMGDTTRRGYRVRFNTTEYLLPNPTDRWATYSTAKAMGAMTVDEIRAAEGLPPLPEQPEPEQEEPPVPDDPEQDQAEQVDASRQPAHTFDGTVGFTLDVTVEQFSVDRENRIIEGIAVPFGQYGTKGGVKFRFDRGALQWQADAPSRVKLVFPGHGEAIGKAIQLKSTPGGLFARFKVGRGAEGDRALESAADGVHDGMSIGVDFDLQADTVPDPLDREAVLVLRSDLRHVALTAEPVFDNARVTRVAASRQSGGGPVPDTETTSEASVSATSTTTTEAEASGVTLDREQLTVVLSQPGVLDALVRSQAPVPAPTSEPAGGLTLSAEQVQALAQAGTLGLLLGLPSATTAAAPVETPDVVNPNPAGVTFVNEALPYRFRRNGGPSDVVFVRGEHEFSADLHEMSLARDTYGETEAGKRVMGLLRAMFADTDTADVTSLNPAIQRPDMYVDQRDFRYPIWESISRGAPPNGVQPFTFPKFNTASGLVGDHVEGTEPTGGTFTTTSQTITPTALSGKASVTREVWDMGGNPAVSTLIFNQMLRGWREGLESAAATFLNTLTAATDITLGVAPTDAALDDAWNQALAGLQFVRGYDFSMFAVEQVLYKAFVSVTDTTGRPLYPIISPQNSNGQALSRFRQIDLSGVIGAPAWALPSTPGSLNNSWLFDPSVVWGWASAPQRLEFPGSGGAAAGVEYKPVAHVDLALWGYKAFANTDIGGVRQVTYDSVAP